MSDHPRHLHEPVGDPPAPATGSPDVPEARGPAQAPSRTRRLATSYGEARKRRIDTLAAASAAGPGPTVGSAGTVDEAPGVSLIASAWRRLRRDPIFLAGAAITLAFIVLALVSPMLAPHDPASAPLIGQVRTQTNPVPGPQPGYPLGADPQGRDLLSRLLVGSRQTLVVGVLATLGGFVGGAVLGTLAGAFGGWVDSSIMRAVDVMLSLPSLLLAVSIATLAQSPSQWTLIIAIAVVNVPIFARLLRGSMLAQRHSDHVLAARALGVKRSAIIFRHMLPNSLGPVIVQATLVLATAIIDAAGLSFLGLGNPDDRQPEWGQMLGEAQKYSRTTRTWRSGRRAASSSSRSASR